MTDYDALIKALRCMQGDIECGVCKYYNTGKCDSEKMCRDAADAIGELQRQIDAWVEPERKALIKSLPKWIPVTERLPEMGKEVLVSDKQKNVTIAWIVGCFSKDGASFEWACSDGWIDDQLPITHWMPLPEPPKEEKENDKTDM